MLEKVKQQTVKTSCDIFEKAAAWNITVIPLQRFALWLEKLIRRAEKGGTGVRELRGDFIKIETGGLRPEFRVLSSGWPRLSFNNQGASPFSHEQASRMTRKSGSKLVIAGGGKEGSSGVGAAGYCEVCRVNYTWLEEHLSSVGHIKAVTDPGHYEQLDALIGAHSLNRLRKSLRIAKSPPPVAPPPPPLTPPSPPPPTLLHCNGHRSPPHQANCNGLGRRGSSSRGREEEGNHNLRSRLASPPALKTKSSRRRLSAEEKLIEDNKAYYKVEVLNSKLRSTGCLQKQQEVKEEEDDDQNDQQDTVTNGQTVEPVVVRFKKVRKTELALLSKDADNFMFGVEKREEPDPEPEPRKRKKSQGEAFISDNQDYYKYELSEPRLRPAGSDSEKEPVDDAEKEKAEDGEGVEEEEVEEEEVSEDLKPNHLEYAFEMDLNPPWKLAQKRQMEREEFHLQSSFTYPKVILPFDLPYQEKLRMLVRRRRRLSRCLDDRPRKSPRCHASTLAMLSCRTAADDDTTTSSASLMESSSQDTNLDPRVVSSSLKHHLATAYDPMMDRYVAALVRGRRLDVDLRSEPCLPVDPTVLANPPPTLPPMSHPPDLMYILQTASECTAIDQSCLEPTPRPFDSALFDSCNSSECSEVFSFSEDGRSFGRRKKRKKRNLTGWPQEKPKKKSFASKFKSETLDSILNGDDAQAEAPVSLRPDGLGLGASTSSPVTPVKRRPGRPRIYPPGMSPHLRKALAARHGILSPCKRPN